MQSRKEREKTGREKLHRIIDACKSVEERSIDPFLIDVNGSINEVKEFFSEWTIAEDLCLDAETINQLASVIKLQGDWIKHRSTSLYTDPFLLEEKIVRLPKDAIAGAFIKAWHPTIEFEQITLHSLKEALRYWENLLPIDERWKDISPTKVEMGFATRDELVRQRILQEKTFSEELENFWHELKNRVQEHGEKGRIKYWGFVGDKTYEESVQRAFLTSFLVTYGYATLEIYPLEEEIFIRPSENQDTKINSKQPISIPIAISKEEWAKWKRGEQN